MTASLDDLLRSAIRQGPPVLQRRGAALTAEATRAALSQAASAPYRVPHVFVWSPSAHEKAQRLLGKEGQPLTVVDAYEAARIELEQERDR